MDCPKCGHTRSLDATNPTWQCPTCGVAYNKIAAVKLAAAKQMQPIAPEQVPGVGHQTSVWILVGANIVALVAAQWGGWTLAELMFVYWVQSLIIGASYVARIMNLDKFSTQNFRINNKAVEATPKTKRKTAVFFVVHFGIFHFAYLLFIGRDLSLSSVLDLGLLVCVISFAVNHWFSYRYHRAVDRAGMPNIGKLMFTPYLRIVPMHMTIIFGAAFSEGFGLLLFGILKTVADVVMHVVEHGVLGKISR
ncbi:MAG: hypothetical protein GKR90_00255 [Pseudomonadales bacterium]|nr:hypothetical protein [Pseudomonadales bacterium]